VRSTITECVDSFKAIRLLDNELTMLTTVSILRYIQMRLSLEQTSSANDATPNDERLATVANVRILSAISLYRRT